MSKKVEIEQKYYCSDFKKLIEVINKKGFSKINEKREIDEYFTDINSEFIRNRTCLRIRITNDERMELTFKGKSKELTNNYAKIENRAKAVEFGINMLDKDDTLILLGKGAETIQKTDDGDVDYNELELVKNYQKRDSVG